MLKSSVAPHLRRIERPFYQAGGVLLCMIPLIGFSCLYYGLRPLLLVLTGMAVAIGVEILCSIFMRRPPCLNDGTSAVTGALIGCMMSPLTPFWVPAMGAAFAIGVVKMPFGGTGRNVFNPAAAGLAFCAICFPTRLFVYPDPSLHQVIPLTGDTSAVITALSPAAQLANNAKTSFDWLSLLFGEFPGPIGSSGVIVLIACSVYLWVRRSSSLVIMVPYLGTCALLAWLFPRSVSANVPIELCTGLLLFTGVFLLCDPVTAPRHLVARMAYGILAGVLVTVLRHYGRFECCEFFAVLMVNAVAPVLDRSCWRLVRHVSEVMKR